MCYSYRVKYVEYPSAIPTGSITTHDCFIWVIFSEITGRDAINCDKISFSVGIPHAKCLYI